MAQEGVAGKHEYRNYTFMDRYSDAHQSAFTADRAITRAGNPQKNYDWVSMRCRGQFADTIATRNIQTAVILGDTK